MGRKGLNGQLRLRLTRSAPQGEPGAGGGGASGGQSGPAQGQPAGGSTGGTGGGDPFAGLFDDLDLGDGGGSGQGGGQPGTGAPAPTGLTAQDVSSMLDSRINKLVNTLDKRWQKMAPQLGQQPPQGPPQGEPQQQFVPQAQTGNDPGEIREARMAIREYLGDNFKPISDVERQLALSLGLQKLAASGVDGDADTTGQAIAKSVATTVLSLREHYSRATIAGLKKKGLLKDPQNPDGQVPGAGSNVGQGVQFPTTAQQGATNIGKAYADQMNAERGRGQQTAGQATG